MKKLLVLLLTLTLLLTGCGAQNGTPANEDAPEKPEKEDLETIDVVLDWYPNAVHSFLYLAKEHGYFADEGLDINIIYPSNTSDPLTMPAAGKADIGFYYQEDTIIAKANENVPVKVLGTVVQEPITIICSTADKGIQTAADLVGKTVGYSGGRFAEVAMNTVLSSAGASLDDIEFIDVGFDLMSAMTTGNVDATYGCFINHEIPAMEEGGFDMNVIKVTDYGVPNYYNIILVTGEKQLEERGDAYARFLRACEKGFADMKADPEAALQLLLDNQDQENFPLTESVERKSFEVLLPMMEKQGVPFLSQDPAVWQKNIEWLKESGMISTTFDPAEILVER